MTDHLYDTNKLNGTVVVLGPRLRAEILSEIHRLEHLFRPSRHELREAAKLRALLRLLGTAGGRDDG